MRTAIVTEQGPRALHALDLVDLTAAFAAGRATPGQAVKHYLARIDRLNPDLNAWLFTDRTQARLEAAASNARWAADAPLSPIDGVPIGVKANIAVAGLPWHAGVGGYRARIAQVDAEVITGLRRAGAVILGILNMHEAALGATNDNPVFGRCHNPYRRDFTPGGSSGGSAAAVAAGLCVAALGTDTMGSVRIPAAYCGVFGHMPAQGRLSTVGVVPLSSTLDRVGVLTRTEEDARALTVAMSSSRPATGRPGPMRLAAVDLSGQVDVDPSVHEAFKATVARARDAGLSVTTISLDGYDAVRLPRACLFIAEVEALSEYGSALDGDAAGLSPQLHGMLSWARRQSPAKRAEAYRTLRLCADALNEQLSGFDALLTPTTNSPAFAFEQPAPQDQAAFALLGNILGWAATAFPVGVDSTGLPLSAQIMCRNDADALSGAGKLARAGGPPPCFSMNAED